MELAEAASVLRDCAAVAGIVCEDIQRQTASYRKPAAVDGYTDLLVTPVHWCAFLHATNEMITAADTLAAVLKRHGA